jgi:hypothetical protein
VRILDAEACDRVRRYIRNNPVARQLAGKATEFPYSSAQPGYQLDPAPQGLKPISSAGSYGIAKAMP